MTGYQRLEINEAGTVTVVRLRDKRIVEEVVIRELAKELFQLVEVEGRGRLLLDFSSVDSLSSAAVANLIALHKKVTAQGGVLKLSNIGSGIREVFVITKLDRLFDIRADREQALAAF